MATEAFALSPMSARAAEPNEQDYDAIREAFMETARGRWFLGEYARRNRNADTSMVLNAVARIEETLAAQRQPGAEDRLPEALIAIRRAIREAETIAIAAVDPAALEASLGPVGRGVRIIREISWRWREIGADGRICDLIDSQLQAIEAACGQISAIAPRAELKAAFDLLRDRVEQMEAGETALPRAGASPVRPGPMPGRDFAATDDAVSEMAAAPLAEEPVTAAPAAMAAMPQAVADAIEIEPDATGSAEAQQCVGESAEVGEPFEEPPADAAAEAEDEAILDMVAFEMGAPDPEFDELPPEEPAVEAPAPAAAEVAEPVAAMAEPVGAGIDEPEIAEPIAAEPIAPAAAAVSAPDLAVATLERRTAPAAQSSPLPSPSPLPEPSLGATILASGILQTPRAPANDPLAPIRRMTQAEKIAFFS